MMDWSTFWAAIGGFASLVSLLLTYYEKYYTLGSDVRYALIISAVVALWTAVVTARKSNRLKPYQASRRRLLPRRQPLLKRLVNALLDAIIDMLIGALIAALIMAIIVWGVVLLTTIWADEFGGPIWSGMLFGTLLATLLGRQPVILSTKTEERRHTQYPLRKDNKMYNAEMFLLEKQASRRAKPMRPEEMIRVYSQGKPAGPGLKGRLLTAAGDALITLGAHLKPDTQVRTVKPA